MMKKANHSKIIKQVLILLCAAFIVACRSETTSDDASTAVPSNEAQSEAITRAVATVESLAQPADDSQEVQRPVVLELPLLTDDLPFVDPQAVNSQLEIDLAENLFIGLTRMNPMTQEIEPALAASWDVSENGRIWTFNLRDDVFWVRPQETSSGWTLDPIAPIVAEDVVWAIQRACQRETNMPDVVVLFVIQGCEDIHDLGTVAPTELARVGVSALDTQTVRFTLTKPSAYFLTITSLWFTRPVPKALMNDPEEPWTTPENYVTSGAFYRLPDRSTLRANPLWPLPFTGNVDSVTYIFVQEEDKAVELWDEQGLDVVTLPPGSQEVYQERFGERLQFLPEQTLFYLGFNFDSGVFKNADIRQAFSAAIDREALVEALYAGQAIGMRHLTPPGVLGAPLPDEVGMGYDPDQARILMAESQYGNCRLMPPITYLANTSDLSLLQAELIRDMWIEELDCTEEQIVIEQTQFGSLLANTRRDAGAARPDIWELGWASYFPDAHNWLNDLMHCQESENRMNRPCGEVDDRIRQAGLEQNLAARLAAYREIESTFFSQNGLMPVIPLYTPGDYLLVQGWLAFTPVNFGGEQYDRYQILADRKRLEQDR